MPFQSGAGWNGNAKGRPKGSLSLKNMMEAELRGKDRAQARAVIRAVIKDAIDHEDSVRCNKARTLLFEYIDGRVPDRIEGNLDHNLHAPLLEAFLAAGLVAGVRRVPLELEAASADPTVLQENDAAE